jgi:ABC-type Fe3+/spermidine/putrescine transport system ATPase subunit
MLEPMISLRGIGKRFGPVTALDDVSFDISRGEFFSLLGPSGCGKTTLLRIMGGFESADSGELWIDGREMSRVPANRRPTNMVFQSYAIFPHLNVRQNIAYGLNARSYPKDRVNEMVDEALVLIRMQGFGDRRPEQLSGGQRQRVALARALVCSPKVLLLDEPLGALDKQLRTEMHVELRNIQRQVGITFVLVTHDQEEALTLSDRIAVMAQGRALQIGSAADLYEQPVSREVAGFIGTMNFLEGRVAGTAGDGVVVDSAVGRIAVPGAARAAGVGAPISIAFRPEKIALSWTEDRPAHAGDGAIVNGTVLAEVYLGDRCYYTIQVAGLQAPIWAAAQMTVRSSGARQMRGKPVWLEIPPEAFILLDSSAPSPRRLIA